MAESAISGSASVCTQQPGEGSTAKQPLEEQWRNGKKFKLDITAHNSGHADEKILESVPFKSHRGVSSAPSKKSLEERKKQQLKKINNNLANRHSKISRRGTFSAKISACFDGCQKYSLEPELVRGNGEKQWSTCGSGLRDSGELAESPVTDASLSYVTAYTDEPRVVSFVGKDPLPVTSNEDDLLNSESSFVPLPLNDNLHLQELRGSTFAAPISSGRLASGTEDTDLYVSSLLSSLDHAYGYSACAGTSTLLCGLVEPRGVSFDEEDARLVKAKKLGESVERGESWKVDTHFSSSDTLPNKEKEAVCIQTCYRGFSARKKFRALLRWNRAATLIQSAWLDIIN